MLYEKGYGKDAASIAMDSIRYARDAGFDVVLIDTAGRMQDNEPLMRALAKVVCLFVYVWICLFICLSVCLFVYYPSKMQQQSDFAEAVKAFCVHIRR